MKNSNIKKDRNEYDAESIKVLKGLDAVRRRPGMYIGDTDDGSGLHHMVYEVVDNAIDEVLAGYATFVKIIINNDGSCSVIDNGRGIPTDIHPTEGVSAAEVIMTQLHAGGKFDQNIYKVSGGLHGVGISVVNALSSWLKLYIKRNNKKYKINFIHGIAENPIKIIEKNSIKDTGTEITFLPNPKIFKITNFNFNILEKRLRELAFLNSGINISLEDFRNNNYKKEIFNYSGGIIEFIKYIDKDKIPIFNEPIYIKNKKNDISVELVMRWNKSYKENVLCFTNNIPQKDGGTHLSGFRSSLTRQITGYLENNILKKEKKQIIGEDCREGLTAILSIKVPDPKFSSQTKSKLVSSEVRPIVENIINHGLRSWLEEHPIETKIILNKIYETTTAREAAKKARDITRRKNILEISTLPGKLSDCQEKNPEKSELFIVEGDSAGGSAKSGRSRKNQAILPLRGKILNVEKAKFDRMLSSDMIGTLITALGTSIGKDKFNIRKLRYHKIIIMTDADVDGAHIRTLLLTFFFRYMIELIENGYLYIAQPPLYRVEKGKYSKYIKNEEDFEKFLLLSGMNNMLLRINNKDIYDENLLNNIIQDALIFRNFIKKLNYRYNISIVEQSIISGLLNNKYHLIHDNTKQILDKVLLKLNNILNNNLFKWIGYIEKNYLVFERLIEGVKETSYIDKELLDLYNLYKIDELQTKLYNIYKYPIKILRKGIYNEIFGPMDLVDNIFLHARCGLKIQRYKGLGEMNADQLWDTTLNPKKRSLLQVTISDIEETNILFSKLMGDNVDHRRNFIQEHALNVKNLDI